MSLTHAISRLRSLDSARLVIQLEDESSRSILPVLKAVAALSNARLIEVRDVDFRAERVTRSKLVMGLASLSLASAVAACGAVSCSLDLSRLLTVPRSDVSLGAAGAALYLNANLWFGVKAGGS